MEKDFSYKVIKKVAVLSQSEARTKELRFISYSGGPPKLDIRSWYEDERGEHMTKGITLTRSEAAALRDALNALNL